MTPIDLFKAGFAFGISMYVIVKTKLSGKLWREMNEVFCGYGSVLGIITCLLFESIKVTKEWRLK